MTHNHDRRYTANGESAMTRWRKLNPDKTKDQRRKEYAKIKDSPEVRSRTNKIRLIHKRRAKMDALGAYGSKCVCCGESNIEFLSFDHINNDGAEHRKSVKSDMATWLRLNNYPPGFQILCFNCNCSKGMFGYCPHDSNVPSRIDWSIYTDKDWIRP